MPGGCKEECLGGARRKEPFYGAASTNVVEHQGRCTCSARLRCWQHSATGQSCTCHGTMLHRSRPRLPPSAFALRRSRDPRTPWRGTPDSPQPAQRGSSLCSRPSQRCVWDASAAGPVQSRRHRGNYPAPRCTVALSPTPAFCARTSHDTRTSHAQVLNLAALPDGMLQVQLCLYQTEQRNGYSSLFHAAQPSKAETNLAR